VTEDEAREVADMLSEAGLPGEASPVDPDQPDGAWCIRHQGQDVTRASLDALIARHSSEQREPGWHDGRPVRGFIIPDSGRG
jgi:hypothetical protein